MKLQATAYNEQIKQKRTYNVSGVRFVRSQAVIQTVVVATRSKNPFHSTWKWVGLFAVYFICELLFLSFIIFFSTLELYLIYVLYTFLFMVILAHSYNSNYGLWSSVYEHQNILFTYSYHKKMTNYKSKENKHSLFGGGKRSEIKIK